MDSTPVQTYAEAVRFLEQGINYERTRRWAYNARYLNLRRVEDMLAEVGNPHQRYRVLHVAGTKGKGSTAGAAERLLRETGFRTGLLTSPHLVTPRERICINGEMIGEDAFTAALRNIQPHVERKRAQEENGYRAPTYFEMLTALAFVAFAERHIDWAVVEVGLGGRLDSTNVVQPDCCVITTIGLDHTDKLGETPEEIAGEKAGIIKPAVPVMIGRQTYPGALQVLRRAADERECPRRELGPDVRILEQEPLSASAEETDSPVGWRFSVGTPGAEYRGLVTPLLGGHQVENLATAIGAVEMAGQQAGFNLRPDQVAAAVADLRLQGRVEVLQRRPTLVLDVAHTAQSVRALVEALGTHFPDQPVRFVLGCSADKDVRAMLKVLRPWCRGLTATEAQMPRAMPAEQVGEAARSLGFPTAAGRLQVIPDAVQAVQNALSEVTAGEVVCLTGSFFTAGEVRAWWDGRAG